jgi:hypothetical protein
MTDRETELAETEVLFREVNEGIATAAGRFESETAEFVCECGDVGCAERIEAPLAEYERVRERSYRFLLVPGHEVAPLERVVARRGSYSIVEKSGERMRRIVARLDPRRRRRRDP